VQITAPELEEIRGGVDIGTSVHLLTAFESDGLTVVARSDALQKMVVRTRFGRRLVAADQDGRGHPFAAPGGTRRLLDKLGPDRWGEVGYVTDGPLPDSLIEGMARTLDVDGFEARGLAAALGGPEGSQHLLRLTLTSPKGELVGGYSIVVS
jgi:hypothetical protein